MADSEIHYRDMLLTLDYLLNHTDEEHPASKEDICKHGEAFGLKYHSKSQAGDDIKRDRIARCIKYLLRLRDEHPDKLPFVMETKGAGKTERYYIEQRHFLNQDQVLQILLAVKNDRYTKETDTDFLIDRLLDSLSSVHERPVYKSNIEKGSKGVRKDINESRKMRLVSKAFEQSLAIKIRRNARKKGEISPSYNDVWHRVYRILEIKGEAHAVMIPIDESHICDAYVSPVEGLRIPKGTDNEVLTKDPSPKRDLRKRYAKLAADDPETNGDIDRLVENYEKSRHRLPVVISFWFDLLLEAIVVRSFKKRFGFDLPYVRCASFRVIGKERGGSEIRPVAAKDGEEEKYGVVRIKINRPDFVSWAVGASDKLSLFALSSRIHVVSPESINAEIASYYFFQLEDGYAEYLPARKRRLLAEMFETERMTGFYRYELINNHIIVEIGGGNYLIDTGSPSSFSMGGVPSSVTIDGRRYPLAARDPRVKLEATFSCLGTEVDGFIGLDIVMDTSLTIYKNGFVDFKVDPIKGVEVPMSAYPCLSVEAECNGVKTRFVIDTGAKYAYGPKGIFEGLRPFAHIKDYNPHLGFFESYLYHVPVTIGGITKYVPFGNNSRPVGMIGGYGDAVGSVVGLFDEVCVLDAKKGILVLK